MKDQVHIALAGNPNAGKTTLFNFLTGARQHVGNYPGVTVDRKEGKCQHKEQNLSITDLPGTYSLTAYSSEELVARDYIVHENPEVIIAIVDASNLERNLYLTCQFLEMGLPLVLGLNMIDVAKSRGIEIDAPKLSSLLGVPVVPIIARSGKGVEKLLDAALTVAGSSKTSEPLNLSYGDDLDIALQEISATIEENQLLTDRYQARWTGIKILENDEQILEKIDSVNPGLGKILLARTQTVSEHLQKTLEMYPESLIADHRYGYIKSIIRQGVITYGNDTDRLYTSDKIDKVLTHRLLGPVIMGLVLFGLYTFTFGYSEIPVGWMENLFGFLGELAHSTLPDGAFKSMVIAGIIDGAGGVLGFVPIIMFMFFGIAILEDSGYLARVAFMMDRIFRMFGLHGSSVMPFIISGGIAGGCAVPGVMAARTLRSPKERMATLLTVPFMNCGAKLPVIALLIGAFFPSHNALYMFLATLIAWIFALLAAKFLRMTILRGESTPFVMELPPYRFPTAKGIFIHTWERTWQYIKKAGTIILGISIILWAMMTYPGLPDSENQRFDQMRQSIEASFSPETLLEVRSETIESQKAHQLSRELSLIESRQAAATLENSIAGRVGKSLESITRFAGFDWRTNIALIGGFAAKEVIISTLGTAYSLGEVDPDESSSLKSRLRNDANWNPIVALGVLVFIMFYAPCFVTLVCIARETQSWRWAAFSMGFNTVIAFTLAVLLYRAGGAFGII